ncbi:MAG: type II secretion system protein GspM [Gammaproteobacteria bacterium]|nr:type II secretion system protein GspM [Gammaproteobacteria bacterium]
MRPPASADRWRILGGVALALLAVYLVTVHWWFTAPMLDMGAQVTALRDEEQTLRLQIAQRPELQARLAQVRQFETDNPGFLPEGTRELASAGLVQRLQQVVANASPNPNACQITAQTPTDMPTQEPYPRVMVQVRLRCGTAELAAVLHALESGSPQLFIDNLDMLSRRSYLATIGDTGGLDVSFDLYGYLKSPREATRG